jgi:hypothetical protein
MRIASALALAAVASLLALPTMGLAHGAPLGARARRSATHSRPPTVTAALQALERSNQLPVGAYAHYEGAYVAAKRSLAKLSGTRHAELAGVLGNVEAMAAKSELIASRLPVVFLTLERNREWWTTQPLLSPKQRVSLPGSHLVWEYYPGQGIEIQWLGTFGEANGYYLSGHENTQMQELLAEAIPLATQRAGGIAWEYMFQFDGGDPPWTSGLSQGTGLQVLARAYSRLHTPAYLTAAQQALGIFQQPPPVGVRVATAAGAEYAEYTYAPNLHILNGFIQALVGLYDYTQITHDPLGEQLFAAGDAEARAEVPHYDTGGWSLYDQYEESDLNYHELLAEFLQHLCERTRRGTPLATTSATTTATTTTTTTASSSTAVTGGAGASTTATTTTATPATPSPIAGDSIYCTTAERFTNDLHEPPTLELLSKTLKGGTRAGVQFALSKVATVSMAIKQGGRTVWSNGATVEGGKPKLLWVTPSGGGVYEVTLSATDLAGNHESTTGTIAVSAASSAPRPRHR